MYTEAQCGLNSNKMTKLVVVDLITYLTWELGTSLLPFDTILEPKKEDAEAAVTFCSLLDFSGVLFLSRGEDLPTADRSNGQENNELEVE